jgi:hypothetical protein
MTTRWQERRPAYRLRTHSRLYGVRRRAVRDFLAWYRRRYPAAHWIPILVVAQPKLRRPSGGVPRLVHGLFWFPRDAATSQSAPAIWVAGGLGHRWRVVHTLAHELAHYREWARTGDTTERGKNQAADALLRAYERETGRSFLP